MRALLTIPAVTLLSTLVCATGLDVPVTTFVAVWAGLTVFAFGLWRFVRNEVMA